MYHNNHCHVTGILQSIKMLQYFCDYAVPVCLKKKNQISLTIIIEPYGLPTYASGHYSSKFEHNSDWLSNYLVFMHPMMKI